MSEEAGGSCHLPPTGFRGAYRDDPLARAVYSEAAGIGRIVPAAVAVPEDAEDVVTLVKWARDRSLPLVARGSGTSMAGGATGAGIVVDLSRMNSIGEVDVAAQSLTSGPGALRGELNRAAAVLGLRFPVDPSSGEYCTIGGMISTNAAGAHSLKFGATRNWVLALDCVFEDGSRAVIRRGEALPAGIPAIDRFVADAKPRIPSSGASGTMQHPGVTKDSSGYGVAAYARSGDLIDILVGSEGTLALIVGVTVKLTPVASATTGILGAFATLDSAVNAAVRARAAGAVACELLDQTFLEVAASGAGAHVQSLALIPPGTEAVLITEAEGANEEEAGVLSDELAKAFRLAGSTFTKTAIDPAEQHEIWELRHAASPILAKLDPSLKSMQFIEDGAVPLHHLAEYVRSVRAALAKRGMRGVIFGHAGDAHVHVNPLIDVTSEGWRSNVESLLEEIVSLTARLGGTLAGEHGDGRLRTPQLARVWSAAATEAFAAIKLAFDPAGILNPGVKVPLTGQKSIGDIKYDPCLAPLPAEARRALDKVSDDRAYSTLRLSMIPANG